MATINTRLAVIDGMSRPMQTMADRARSLADRITATRDAASGAASGIRNAGQAAEQAARHTNTYGDAASRAAGGTNLLGKAVKGLIAGFVGALSIRTVTQYLSGCTDAMNKQIEAETKLSTVMRQRMNATDAEIRSITELASAQQKLGIIGDEVQLAGAQQLSTFLDSTEALQTLLPAMNNLAAQQAGVGATAENLVSIGNLMGKVMQGQTSALTRVGITFTEAQEAALKYGTEQERAAVLAQVITDNVGQMNAALAATPSGQIQQLANEFGDMREELGARIAPALSYLYAHLQAAMPTIQLIMDGVARFAVSVILWIGQIIGWIDALGQFVQTNWDVIRPILVVAMAMLGAYLIILAAIKTAHLIGAAVAGAHAIAAGIMAAATGAEAAATTGAAIATERLNLALLKCPIVWIVLLIVGLIVVIFMVVDAINKARGTTFSVLGAIVGAIAVFVTWVKNQFINVYNGIVTSGVWLYNRTQDLIVGLHNLFAWLAAVLSVIFKNPVNAIATIFLDLFDWLADKFKAVAQFVDDVTGTLAEAAKYVPFLDGVQGTHFVNTVETVQQGVHDAVDSKFEKVNIDDVEYDKWNAEDRYKDPRDYYRKKEVYKDVWSKWYKVGADTQDKAGKTLQSVWNSVMHGGLDTSAYDDLMNKLKNPEAPGSPVDIPDEIDMPGWYKDLEAKNNVNGIGSGNLGTVELGDVSGGKISDIADDTASIAKAMEITGTQLKYLFDIASREAVNRFTTASIKVDMTNNNTINSDADIDGIVTSLKTRLEDQMYAVAEGAH